MSDTEDILCSECDREECIFDEFRKDFIETESWRVERELIESRLEAGNLRQRALRKTLFVSFWRFNGIAGNREKHPACVVRGVRELFSSPFYMGFKRTRNDLDNCAIDIDGNKIKKVKWVKTEEGRYEAKNNDEEVQGGDCENKKEE